MITRLPPRGVTIAAIAFVLASVSLTLFVWRSVGGPTPFEPRHQLRQPRTIEREHLQLLGAMNLAAREPDDPLVRILVRVHGHARRRLARTMQSLRLWHLDRDEQRTFYMSTPRLSAGEGLEWRAPFASPALDLLCGLDGEPRPRDANREALGAELGGEALDPYLVPAEPRSAAPPAGGGVRLRHVGHACVLAECVGVSILTDPFVAPRPRLGGAPRLSFGDLPPRID
jgi:hypothetical protein